MPRVDDKQPVAKLKSMMVDDFPIALDRRKSQRYTSEGTFEKAPSAFASS